MSRIVPGPSDALIVVDVQNDFLPGGAPGVAHGGEVLARLGPA
jgi:nicotinamidase/pyrazinamidase